VCHAFAVILTSPCLFFCQVYVQFVRRCREWSHFSPPLGVQVLQVYTKNAFIF